MPWNEPGGNQQDPWTGKKKTPGKQDAEELIKQLNQKLGGLFGNGKGGDGNSGNASGFKGVIVLLVLLVAGWLFSGFYTVDARQQALVLQFGAFKEKTSPGLHWRFPAPIQTVEMIDVAQNRSAQDRSTMLTKDENIVDIAVTVQYKVSDAEDYAFNVFMPDNLIDQTQGTLYQAMRSSAREVIGRSNMDFILGEGREQIALSTQSLMQDILDGYQAGLQIIKVNLTYAEAPEAVKDAFDDANRAREDANRFKNEADTYANKVVPEARGQAARLLEEANAYRQQIVARAEGDASRFSQLATEYRKAPGVTRERLYLETMETVMGGSRKVLIDSSNSNNLLYIPTSGSGNTGDQPSPATMASPFMQQTDTAAPKTSVNTGRTSRSLSTTERENRQ